MHYSCGGGVGGWGGGASTGYQSGSAVLLSVHICPLTDPTSSRADQREGILKREGGRRRHVRWSTSCSFPASKDIFSKIYLKSLCPCQKQKMYPPSQSSIFQKWRFSKMIFVNLNVIFTCKKRETFLNRFFHKNS